jgi:hypothetical protein
MSKRMSSLATGVTGFLPLYHLLAGLFVRARAYTVWVKGLAGSGTAVYIVDLERTRSSLLRGCHGADYGYSLTDQ